MEVYRPHRADAEEMARFHSPEYVDFLRRLTGGHDAGMQVRRYESSVTLMRMVHNVCMRSRASALPDRW